MSKIKSEADRKRRLQRDAQLATDWQAIARTPEGRRIIADLFGWGWVFQPLEDNDPMELARHNGERNFALRVARYLNLDAAVFAAAMRQNDEAVAEWMGENEYREQMAAYFRPPSGLLNS